MMNKKLIVIVLGMTIVIAFAFAKKSGIFELRKQNRVEKQQSSITQLVKTDEPSTEYDTVHKGIEQVAEYEIGEFVKCRYVPMEIRTDYDNYAKNMKEIDVRVNTVRYTDKITGIPEELKGQITGINEDGTAAFDNEIFAVVNITLRNRNKEDYTFWLNNIFMSRLSAIEESEAMLCCYDKFDNWYDSGYFGLNMPANNEVTTDMIYTLDKKYSSEEMGLYISPSGISQKYDEASIINLGKIKG